MAKNSSPKAADFVGEDSPQSKRKSGQGHRKSGRKKSQKSGHKNNHLNNIPDGDLPTKVVEGALDTAPNNHGVLRIRYSGTDRDAYISSSQIKRFNLRTGDMVKGPARRPKDNERYWGLLQIDTINGIKAEKFRQERRPKFKSLTPVYPNERIKLEIGKTPLSLRIIDMIAPIGKGQRSLIVSPPRAGKTTLLKNIATGMAKNSPEIHLMAVLVGERPEEVTDIRRHMARISDNDAEVAASNFDESAEDQCRVAELALARAKRRVEIGEDVAILLDSITRLARAYNLSMPTSGRTLSGGFDPAALFPPKRFFGAARNFEDKGSLTIVGTALIHTGSRMDDLIYEEFKGTGNQEIHLDRKLAERRIYPAIDVQKSGTRKDELLLDQVDYQSVITLQRMLDTFNRDERTSTLIGRLKRSDSNKEFLGALKNG
jgi:transcription termination factor Rho